jgi:hypothetical protein
VLRPLLQYCRNLRRRRVNFSLLHDPNPRNQPLHLSNEMDHRNLDKSKRLEALSCYPNTKAKAMTREAVLVCSSGRRRLQALRRHGLCQTTVRSTSSLEEVL